MAGSGIRAIYEEEVGKPRHSNGLVGFHATKFTPMILEGHAIFSGNVEMELWVIESCGLDLDRQRDWVSELDLPKLERHGSYDNINVYLITRLCPYTRLCDFCYRIVGQVNVVSIQGFQISVVHNSSLQR
jgi:hypothetical protein